LGAVPPPRTEGATPVNERYREMNQKSSLILLVSLLLVGGSWLMQRSALTADDEKDAPAKEKPQADEKKEPVGPRKIALKNFMRKKLEASQKMLEGLVVEDFDLIRQGTKQAKGISAAAEFVVSDDPLYTQHADEFRRICDRLEKAAKEKRIDGTALAYMDLTLSCIECHKFVRNILIAQ
jgi:cytochrome c556